MKTSKEKQLRNYAVYKDDTFIIWGTAEHIAERLNIQIKTVRWYASAQNLRANEQNGGRTIAVVIEEDEHE